MKRLTFLSLFSLISLAILLTPSCKKDEPTPTEETPVASFQYEISSSDYFTVAFTNFSQNANSYAWDFGDGNSSTDKDPSHTYTAGGDYEVTLVATNSTKTHNITKTITIVDPNSASKKLTGETSKTWKLSRNVADEEYPLIVGPEDKSQIWWAYGLNDPIGQRVCLMEEEYIFNVDGSFTYNSKGSVFADYGIWSADLEGNCVDDTDAANMVGPNGEDLSAWAGGQFTFDYDPSAGTLTLNGLGAHVGLPKVGTNSEVSTPQSSVTYKVTSIETDGPVDKMYLETTITGGYWQFILVSYDDPADEPDLPGAPPVAAFDHVIDGSTVTFTNNSVSADSYSWDFGDGTTSTEENPVHTYANDGAYTVVLTATNANGDTETTASIIISTMAQFSASALHGDGTKTWKMNPEEGAFAVGDSKGASNWWKNTLDDVTNRACTFDDTYTFSTDNVFAFNNNGDLWGETYMGFAEDGCVNEADLSADAAAWGSGNHTFTVTEATGDDPAYVTVTGTGAFIALPKAYNGGEYAAPPPTVDGSVTYEVLSYINDGSKETMVLTIDISENQVGGAYWTFTLVAE